MSQNLQFAGLRDGEGNQENRWPELVKRIKSADPPVDFLLVQETADWDKYGHRYLVRAMNDLDMEALPLPPSGSGNRPALLYRRETIGRWQRWNPDYAGRTVHGFGVAAFDVGLPALLSVTSVHLNPFSADIALQEIGLISSRAYRYGPFSIIGGDCNYPPGHGPEPDYKTMKPYNTSARTVLTDPAGKQALAPDRRIGWKLEQAGFVDVAYHLFEKTGDKKYLARTASDDRIDQFWVSQSLAPAIVDYWIVDKPASASDHKGVVFQFDTEQVDKNVTWRYH